MGYKKSQRDMLDWLGIRHAPDWEVARPLGKFVTVFVALLISGAYFSAFAIVYSVLFGGSAANLGTGALIAALLSAPFVVWGTVLKHQTLRYQKEGHITDRITSAVEQLGAEKTVNRIGRPVTIWTGKPKKWSWAKRQRDKHLNEPRSKVTGSQWDTHYNEETGERLEGEVCDVKTWPDEKTVIQWQGEEITPQGSDEIGSVGDWQVFTENAPNIEVRIGAILSLERIAQDSALHDKGRDHVRVMEILSAYVRENAPEREAPHLPFPRGCTADTIPEKTKPIIGWQLSESSPRSDVQLALSVIGRRTPRQVKFERDHLTQDGEGYRVDLSRTNLRYADLEYLDFEKANFYRSQMQAAFCKGAKLASANFAHCELTGIHAPNANLSKSNIELADFSHAILTNADLRDCKISQTHFVKTDLKGAKIRFLKNKNDSEMNRASFVETPLRGALIEGDMLGVYFSLKLFLNEKIRYDMSGVGFRNCRIAKMSSTFGKMINISAIPTEWLDATFGDASVILSDVMEPPAHWPDWKLPPDGNNSFDSEWDKWQAELSEYVPPPEPI